MMLPEYADLRAVTSAVECYNSENYIDEYLSNCDPWGRPFNYPPIWVAIFNFFGLGLESTTIVGLVLAILVSISLSFWCYVGIQHEISKKKIMSLSGFLFSPSIYLLSERGNTDSIIFILITTSLFLYFKNIKTIAILIITLASILKVFPIILLIVLALREKHFLTRLLSISGVLTSLIYLIPFFPKILSNTPNQKQFSFGIVNLVSDYFPAGIDTKLRVFLVFFGFVSALGLLLFCSRNASVMQTMFRTSQTSDSYISVFLLMWSMFIFIYLTTSSFNYRIVFLVPIVALLLRFNTLRSNIAAGLFMPYVILAIHVGPSSRLLDVTLLTATVFTTFFWLSALKIQSKKTSSS
jgi:hypothetical protein